MVFEVFDQSDARDDGVPIDPDKSVDRFAGIARCGDEIRSQVNPAERVFAFQGRHDRNIVLQRAESFGPRHEFARRYLVEVMLDQRFICLDRCDSHQTQGNSDAQEGEQKNVTGMTHETRSKKSCVFSWG